MNKYRITNPEPGLFAPAVKRPGLFSRWVALDDQGFELIMGIRWSGPLGAAVNGVVTHGQIANVKVEAFDIEDALRHRLYAKDGRIQGFAEAADDIASIVNR